MIRTTLQVATITWGAGGRVGVGTTPSRPCVNTQRSTGAHPIPLLLSHSHLRRHHSRTTSLPADTQSLCYPCDTSDRRVGHANGIVAPLWKLCGRARLQFAPCQLYLRIGSHDDTASPGLDETRRDVPGWLSDSCGNLIVRSAPPGIMCAGNFLVLN